MPPRATFKGFLRLSLVSVPVKAFTASESSADIRLNQLHEACNNRIRYKKTCPEHGEVANDEIVSGYEYSKDHYVIVEPDEIAKIRKQSDKAVEIEGFVKADQVDPMYYSGRAYYLLPDGNVGQKPYQLFRESMEKEGLFALARAVLSQREQMVVIRPRENLLVMSVLQFAAKVKDVGQFEEELEEGKITDAERQLTKTLIDASLMEEFDFAAYKDNYAEQMTELIDRKVAGEEIVAIPDPEEPKVINLMEALKASVESAQRSTATPQPVKKTKAKKTSSKKVKTKMAPSKAKATSAKRRKKSG